VGEEKGKNDPEVTDRQGVKKGSTTKKMESKKKDRYSAGRRTSIGGCLAMVSKEA